MGDRTLYKAETGDDFYWIPDDALPPRGELSLRSLSGRQLVVDAAAVAQYAVPEAKAKELAAQQMRQVARRTGGFLSGAKRVLERVGKAQRQGLPGQAEREAVQQRSAEALDVSLEQLKNDPDAVLAALKDAAREVRDQIRDVPVRELSEDETRERIGIVIAYANEQLGTDFAATPEGLGQAMRALFARPELLDPVRDSIAELRQTAKRIREGSTGSTTGR